MDETEELKARVELVFVLVAARCTKRKAFQKPAASLETL